MATDQSLPRHRLIFVMAAITLVSLVGLKFAFDSYFTDMFEAEAKAKIAKPEELWKLREDETKRLTQSPLPIDQAMQQVGRGREASPIIAPQQSTDDAPMVGWARRPKKGGEGATGGAGAGAPGTTTTTAAGGPGTAGAGSNQGEPTVGDAGTAIPLGPDAGGKAGVDAGAVRRVPNPPLAPVRPDANTG